MSFRLPIRIGIGILSRPFPFHSMGLCHSRPLTTSTKAIQWTPRFPPINALRLRSSPSLILHFLQTTHRPSPISLLPRTFSTSSRNSVRHTSFPNSSGGRGNPGPRPKYWRHWIFWKTLIDANPPMFIIYGLIAVNVALFVLWQYAHESWTRFKDPGLLLFMQRNMVLNEANIMSGRIWTLITSCFSHSKGDHIFFNCLGLYFIAPAAANMIGSSAFLGLYLAGGVIASVTSLLWHRSRGDRWGGSEGASGAIYSTLAFWGALYPEGRILLFFVIPMPVWVFISGVFAYDLYGSVFTPNSGIDSAGHVGGLLAGLAMAYRMRKGRFGGFRRY